MQRPEAKNGDKIVKLEASVPGNDYCNGNIAESSPRPACIIACTLMTLL
jgi:hypothetical protein